MTGPGSAVSVVDCMGVAQVAGGSCGGAGVDVSGVRVDPDRPTGLLVKDVGSVGTRVHYYRHGSAASRPYAVSFDVNHRPALWPEASAPTVLRDLADRADITFVDLDEAQALWGDALTADDIRALLSDPRVLVVKDGSREALAYGDHGTVTVPALKADVAESVGAGDAFAAGFLAGLLDRADLTRALRLGHFTAASALAVTGDHGPLPDRAEIDRLLSLSEAEWAG